MAQVGEPGIHPPDHGGFGTAPVINIKTSGGIFGPLARHQYAALRRLRWRMFVNGLRSKKGALELGAQTVGTIIYASIGLAVGAGMGSATYFIASRGEWRFLPIVFWVLAFLWQAIPVVLASFQEQFDLGILLRFPVSFGSYFLLFLVFGLVDVSTILGGLCCMGIFAGVAVARPSLLPWTTLALAVFAAFNILLVRAVFAWIDRWLAQRRTREILGAVFMLGLLSLQLLNPALYQKRHAQADPPGGQVEQFRVAQARLAPWLKRANAVQRWLPPGLAARSLSLRVDQHPAGGLASLGLLGLCTLGVGAVLGLRLKAEYRGESLSSAPARVAMAQARSDVAIHAPHQQLTTARPTRFSPIFAVMEKDVRSLLRTLPLLYAIGAPLLLVLVFSGIIIRNGGVQTAAFPFALPACMVYAQLGFTQVFYNSLGTEGAGIQLYFLSPTPLRSVMLAKNMLHAVMFAIVATLAGTLTSLRLGVPGKEMMAATAAWILFSLPCNLAAGNVFSIRMPYRVNPGRISRQRGSQANSLLSLLVQLGVLAVSAVVFWLCWFLHHVTWAVPMFLAMSALATLAWWSILGSVESMAYHRRDALIATLMKES